MRKLGLALCLSLVGLAPAHAQDVVAPTQPNSINGAYNATPPTCISTHGCWLQTDINGQLKVVGTFTPSGSSPEFTPVAPATATATKGVLSGCQYDSTQKTLTDGQQAAVSCTNRGAYIVAPGADGFAVTNAGTFAVQLPTTPTIAAGSGVVPSTSSESGAATTAASGTVAASNLVLKSGAGNLYDLTVTVGATSGYVMLFDATSLPANGAVTPVWCAAVTSNGTSGGISAAWPSPKRFGTGITAGFSTTGCFTITASATANFFGDYK